jgi:carboxymethylenebutenolidase
LNALNLPHADNDNLGAERLLLDEGAVEGDSVGIVGFCMGGALSLYGASKNEQVGACVVFYGIHPKVEPDVDNLRAPVLGIFAEKDKMVTPDAVRALEDTMRGRGKSIESHTYPDTDHAFFNDARPEVYDAAASADAWRRTLAFLRAHLGGVGG